MLQFRVLGNQIKLSHNFDAIFCSILINKYQIAPSKAINMTTITNSAQNSDQDTQQPKPHLPSEIKIQEQQPNNKISFHDVSGLELQNVKTGEKESLRKEQILVQLIPKPIKSQESAQKSVMTHNQVSKMGKLIVEEKDDITNKNFQHQFKQFSSSNWLLPRHPNSLFKVIPKKQKIQRKKSQTKISPNIISSACKSDQINGQVQPKSTQLKCQDDVKHAKIQSKTKKIHKNPNFKPRKGKNQQPIAQKFIKKLSGFHYNKNYKQNRNKTLKKLAKRGLAINLQNFTEYIGKLKLQINKKFTKPDMKIKTNAKGEQVNPKKFYDLYHSHFPLQKQREFVEKFYNEVFKRVYVIMWKSDERLKRIDSIKIEGVHYDTVETDPSSDVKIQHKEMESEKQPVTDSKAEDKRAAFVQCLDDEGKMELDRVFDEEYDKLYDGFDWSVVDKDFIRPEKDSLKSRILKFSWLED